jgi:DNA primase
VRYGEETIERIREAAGLVELIGSTVALRKVGQTWKGLCPFHQEKTPSFTVNPDRQAYHCFGCGAGGDCFRFVMETEKLSFVEAVQALADRFGVPLPKPAEEEQHGRAYQALEEAATFYRRVLEDPEAGRAARDYLAARGLSPATLEAFGVGLAPAGWDQLLSRLGPRLGTGALIEAGLVVARERGEGHYDRFRSRIVVPLRLPSGRVVGFGGRALGDEEPKYLNSPETAVYRKGRFLFGLDRARAAIREQGRAVLVEGYFDVLGLAQAGVTEAIATCGTALTGEQCRIVQRTAPAILLVFDGDTAGQAAAEKALVPCVQAGLAARVVTLPAGEDPDTLVRGRGREAFDRLVAEARSPVAFLAARHAGDREAALRACARLAAAAEDPIISGLLVEEAAAVLSFDGRALAREVEGIRRGGPRPRPAAVAPATVAERRAPLAPTPREEKVARDLETGFLKLLVAHPELLGEAAAQVDPSWFRVPSTRAVAEALLGEARRDPREMLADPTLEPSLRERLSEILTSAGAVDQAEETYGEWVTKLKGRAIDRHRAELQREIARVSRIPGAEDELKRLMMEMQDPAAALRDLRRSSEARRKERA